MKTRVAPYTAAHVPAVEAMNARLKAGGSAWGFYDCETPAWLGGDSAIAARRYDLAVDADGAVHGGIVLKTQELKLGDATRTLLTWQGPVSEGLVDRTFASVGAKLLMRLRDEGLPLFGWGGSDQLNPLVKALGWKQLPTPFLMKLVRPGRVAKGAPFLRQGGARRWVMDFAAATGLAALGGRLLTLALRWRAGASARAVAHAEPEFGAWADEIWAAARDHYRFIAVRDRAALDRVVASWPGVTIRRVERDGRTIGWAALLVTPMQGDRRFGDLTVGSVIDALSIPGEERATIAAATRALAAQGVDLVAVNATHSRWLDAFAADGFLRFDGRRLLHLPEETEILLKDAGVTAPDDLHLMPIDGDGPLGL